ncbi:hypothetical protein ANN_27535 [Periplaneta americana]|uniref:C2H2-type domain-containing protein n=1 Tax=Periplaneta americana TaxID=6978 RepID=A0ABQ8RW13_PERAM|nr:hypothetical protein ANN_27535 [Periplaneta americana]
MSPGSSTESYPFAHIGLRGNPGKKLNQLTCPDQKSKPGHQVSRPDALTVTPQVWTLLLTTIWIFKIYSIRWLGVSHNSNISGCNPHKISYTSNEALRFVMDVCKTEPEFDLLAVQSSDDAHTKEANLLPDEGLGAESTDSNYDLKWEVKIEDTAVPITFPVEKCDPEEKTFDVSTVKEESVLEVTTVESDVLTESILDTDEIQTPQEKHISPENCVASENRSEIAPESKIYSHLHTRKNNLLSQSHSHTENRTFNCDACGEQFSEPGSLTSHVRTHTNEESFNSDSCGKRFSTSGNVGSHVRKHTGEKSFKCDTCGKQFSKYGNLQTHVPKRGKKRQIYTTTSTIHIDINDDNKGLVQYRSPSSLIGFDSSGGKSRKRLCVFREEWLKCFV